MLAVFVLSSTINYLDRQIAGRVAPRIRGEFSLSDTRSTGWILAAFSIALRAMRAVRRHADRPHRPQSRDRDLAVGVWSLAGIATGFTNGIDRPRRLPRAARARRGRRDSRRRQGDRYRTYGPRERASATPSIRPRVAFGWMLAPILATGLSLPGTWRTRFIVTGALGSSVDSNLALYGAATARLPCARGARTDSATAASGPSPRPTASRHSVLAVDRTGPPSISSRCMD